MTPAPSFPRRLLQRTGLVLGAVVVACLLLEAGARAVAHAADKPRGLDYDPVLGWHMLPDIVKRGAMWCAKEPARTNSHGWRDAEHSLDRVPGRRRILALGDSFTFGHGVDYGDRYTELLEEDLGCEVVNMAACAYGTDQELLAFETEGRRFSPDLVLLTVFLANDLDDIALSHSSGWAKPYFELHEGELTLVPPEADWRTRIRTHSYLGELLFQEAERTGKGKRRADAWRDADTMPLFDALLRRLDEGVRSSGATLLVALVHPLDRHLAGEPWPRAAAIGALLTQAGIRCVDTFAPFQEKLDQSLWLPEDPHWSPAGHRVMADLLERELQRMDW